MSQPEPESTPNKDLPSSTQNPVPDSGDEGQKQKTVMSSGKSFNTEPHPKAPAPIEEPPADSKSSSSNKNKGTLDLTGPQIDHEIAKAIYESIQDTKKARTSESQEKPSRKSKASKRTLDEDADDSTLFKIQIRLKRLPEKSAKTLAKTKTKTKLV